MPHPTLPHAEPSSIDRGALWMMLVGAIALGGTFVGLFDEYAVGISAPLFAVLYVALLGLVSWRTGGAKLRQHPLLVLGFGFFATMLFVRASPLLTALNVLLALGFGLALTQAMAEREPRTWLAKKLLWLLALPLRLFERFFATASALADRHAPMPSTAITKQVAKGLAIALPILLVFVGLFAWADAVFRRGITTILDSISLPETLPKLLLTLVMASLFLGVCGYVATYRGERPDEAPRSPASRRWGIVVSSVVLGTTSLLFATFIAIQARFLFGGEAAIASYDLTYAEYARQGFFQLIVVAIIAFLLLWLAERRTALATESSHGATFAGLATVLALLTVAIMGSAFYRLSLYEQAYGLTALRLWSHAFVVWLLLPFGLLLWHKVYDRRNAQLFAAHLLVAMVGFIVVANIANPDRLIASSNLRQFGTQRADTDYLARLSYDAVPVTAELVGISLPETSQMDLLASTMRHKHDELRAKKYAGWPAWHWGRARAMKALDAKEAALVKHTTDLEERQEAKNAEEILNSPQTAYRNTAYGYSFTHPTIHAPNAGSDERGRILPATPTSPTVYLPDVPGLLSTQTDAANAVIVDVPAERRTPREMMGLLRKDMDQPGKLAETTFGGIPAIETISVPNVGTPYRVVVIENKGRTIVITQRDRSAVLDAVMSSFSFAK